MALAGQAAQAAYTRHDIPPQMVLPLPPPPPPPPYAHINLAVATASPHQHRPGHPYDNQPLQQPIQFSTSPNALAIGTHVTTELPQNVPQQQQSHPQNTGPQPYCIFAGRFTLFERLGSGGFGEVYRAEELNQPTPIAVKVEQVSEANSRPEQSFLFHEAKVMQEIHKSIQANIEAQRQQRVIQLQQEQAGGGNHQRVDKEAASAADAGIEERVGIAKLKYYGQDGLIRVLIMSLHGQSLANVHRQQGRLSLFATVMIADQILTSLEHVHNAGYVHADLKPDNVLFGREDPEQLYLVDFGLSVSFRDRKGNHRPLVTNHSFVGTPRFASLRTHMGYTLSRRDDIEQLVYVMIFLFRGFLPWSGLCIEDPTAKEKRIAQIKSETPLDLICAGCPEAFRDVLNYARCMEFEEEPQYQFLHVLLCSLRDSCTLHASCKPSNVAANTSGGIGPQMLPSNTNFTSRLLPQGHAGNDGAHYNFLPAAVAEGEGIAKKANITSGNADQIEGMLENQMMMSSPGAGAPAFFSDAIGQGFLSGNGTDAGPLSPRIDCLNGQRLSPMQLDLQLPIESPQLKQMR